MCQFALGAPEQPEIEVHPLQLGQFDRQQLQVPLGDLGGLVVRDAEGLHLLRRQAARHMHRHLGKAQRLRRLEPRVPEDHSRFIDHDRLPKAELPN